jgi:hypothetical protein
MNPDTHYQILEIEPGASKDDIRQAYRDLVKVWHPDRFLDDLRLQRKAEEKLKQINAAYEFLKSYQPQTFHRNNVKSVRKQPVVVLPKYERLEKLLELGKLKDADHETKRLLLELAGREKEGWLRPEDIRNISLMNLSAIDQLWVKYSNGRFGFSVQSRIWRNIGCISSGEPVRQTNSENKFGQTVGWRVGANWISPGDSFTYDFNLPTGNLPKQFIFTLSGWWSYSKGWTGYFLLRFDDVFLRF